VRTFDEDVRAHVLSTIELICRAECMASFAFAVGRGYLD